MSISTLEQAIYENNNLIYGICAKYRNYADKEDLYQQGIIGLIKAFNNYDSSKNTKFSTYAFPYILGEMSNFVRENKNIILSRDIIRLGKKIKEYIEKHKQVRGYEPKIKDIAKMLNIDEKKVIFALEASSNTKSIDERLNEDEKELTLLDVVSKKENITTEQLIDLKEAFKYLSSDERNLLINRYFNDLTQTTVAKLMNVNQVYVSRLEKKALRKMRDKLS